MKKLLVLGLLAACAVASAQVNLTTIPSGTTLSGNELILMQQPPTACNGCTVTTTPAAVETYVAGVLIPSQAGKSGQILSTNGSMLLWIPQVTVPTGANPSAQVGLTAVPGSSASFMRADAAPPIDQSITPTWTGLHTFDAGLSATTVTAGTLATNAVQSSSGVAMNGATGGSEGSGSINATGLYVNGVAVPNAATGCTTGNFSASLFGFTATITPTIYYSVCGETVHLYVESTAGLGTSNSTNFTAAQFPGLLLPTVINSIGVCREFENSGVDDYAGTIQVNTSGTEIFGIDQVSGSNIVDGEGQWNASGQKGLTSLWNCTYSKN